MYIIMILNQQHIRCVYIWHTNTLPSYAIYSAYLVSNQHPWRYANVFQNWNSLLTKPYFSPEPIPGISNIQFRVIVRLSQLQSATFSRTCTNVPLSTSTSLKVRSTMLCVILVPATYLSHFYTNTQNKKKNWPNTDH